MGREGGVSSFCPAMILVGCEVWSLVIAPSCPLLYSGQMVLEQQRYEGWCEWEGIEDDGE